MFHQELQHLQNGSGLLQEVVGQVHRTSYPETQRLASALGDHWSGFSRWILGLLGCLASTIHGSSRGSDHWFPRGQIHCWFPYLILRMVKGTIDTTISAMQNIGKALSSLFPWLSPVLWTQILSSCLATVSGYDHNNRSSSSREVTSVITSFMLRFHLRIWFRVVFWVYGIVFSPVPN